MLKVRIMPTLLFKDIGLVKGVQFDSWRRIGTAMQAVKVYNIRQVDELVFLDIAATAAGRGPDLETIDELADECFMPLTVGGGIRSADDVRDVLKVGADKVSLGTIAMERPSVVTEVAERFGSQCAVVCLDAVADAAGRHQVMVRGGTRATGVDVVEAAQRMEAAGAGEILLQSVDRDGTMAGYDTDLIAKVSEAVSVPVVASGGAGSPRHMAEALAAGASAVAAASMFHFTEQTPLEAKQHLGERGFPVRS